MHTAPNRTLDRPIESLLLPYSGLPDVTQERWDHDPLTIHRVSKLGRHLLLVGVRHDTDCASGYNRHWDALQEGFDTFLGFARDEPAVVVTEGGLHKPRSDLHDPAYPYLLYGEGAAAALYAQKYGFEQVSFEPPGQGREQVLGMGISGEAFDAYLFGRFVPTYWLQGRRPNFEQFMHNRLTGQGNLKFDWGGPAPTYQYLKDNWEDIYNGPFTPDDYSTLQFLRRETHGYMLPPRSMPHMACIATNFVRDKAVPEGIYQKFVVEGMHTLVIHCLTHVLTWRHFVDYITFHDKWLIADLYDRYINSSSSKKSKNLYAS